MIGRIRIWNLIKTELDFTAQIKNGSFFLELYFEDIWLNEGAHDCENVSLRATIEVYWSDSFVSNRSNTVMCGRPWGLFFRENCGLAYWIWSVFLRCFDNKYILLLRKKKIFLWATMASSFTFQILHFTRTQKNKIVIKTRERRDKRILKIVKVERKKHTQAASELGERNDTKMTKEKRG